MSARPAIATLASCFLLLAACERHEAGPVPRGVGTDAGTAEWRGTLPCADCEGIDTRLLLEQRDGERLYELVEVFVAADGDTRFDEAGHWSVDGVLLSLEPGEGGTRHYGLVRGGALQVRDARGRVYPGREHDLLLPAGHP